MYKKKSSPVRLDVNMITEMSLGNLLGELIDKKFVQHIACATFLAEFPLSFRD